MEYGVLWSIDIFRLVGHDILVGLISVMKVFRYYFCAGIISEKGPKVKALVDQYEIYIFEPYSAITHPGDSWV